MDSLFNWVVGEWRDKGKFSEKIEERYEVNGKEVKVTINIVHDGKHPMSGHDHFQGDARVQVNGGRGAVFQLPVYKNGYRFTECKIKAEQLLRDQIDQFVNKL